ncbi:hypothetical protein LZ31DRAFT_217230 [Colletotrichum somersetense]|nr:hypothetical protein LZ31DRAFT_217230 [Colletotrichum somersetense]
MPLIQEEGRARASRNKSLPPPFHPPSAKLVSLSLFPIIISDMHCSFRHLEMDAFVAGSSQPPASPCLFAALRPPPQEQTWSTTRPRPASCHVRPPISCIDCHA